jgi:diguanylate cyclase (GGDEF)-like protein
MKRTHAWRWFLVPFNLCLVLLILVWLPTRWFIAPLVVAVVLAPIFWGAKGGLIAALCAGPILAVGLWRTTDLLLWNLALEGGYLGFWLSLGTLAVVVGYFTEQARATTHMHTELRLAHSRLEALHQIALSLSSTLDVTSIMEKILDQLGQLWGYTQASILLLDEATNELVVAAERGYLDHRGHRVPSGNGVAGAVVEQGRAINVGDVTQFQTYVPGVPGTRSELAVPLEWNGRVIGVLNVESPLLNAYGPDDLNLLATVAEQAAVSLGNARLHQHTKHLAITDPQTGLYNYRHFQDMLTIHLRDAQLTGNQCSFIMLDLDLFKRYNDTYGHPTGDAILQQLAQVIRETCRQPDLLFRYGGEEFALLLPGTSNEVACVVGERIRERIATYPFITRSGRPVFPLVTASIGVATYPQDGMSPIDLVLAADHALYVAKSEGRNLVRTASTAHGLPPS